MSHGPPAADYNLHAEFAMPRRYTLLVFASGAPVACQNKPLTTIRHSAWGLSTMNAVSRTLADSLDASIACKRELAGDAELYAAFEEAVSIVVNAYRLRGRIYTAGNGGSCSDAQHLAAEFVCKLSTPRAPLAAEALTADTATLTAIGNDLGFDEVFARQLECKMTAHDVFIALSTSGESRNIVRALEQCHQMEGHSILFGGRGGGRARKLADVAVIVPGDNSCRVQEGHIVLYHTLVACVESALFTNEPPRTRVDAPALSAHTTS
jgi:D-sedoheptulose 7-phosphate isomerase